jgi:hypothetical protein
MTTEHGLISDELVRLFDLIRQSDSVELKLTVPESAQRSTLAALGVDPLDAQIREVFFFDTPDLALDAAGVVVRARRVQGRGDDTVVKLRPVLPDSLSDKVRRSPNFVVEVDTMPGGYVCSGSFKAKLSVPAVRGVVTAAEPIRRLFTKEQREFYRSHAPEGIALDDLSVLGPIFVLKDTFVPEGLARRLVVEMWLYPEGSRILELSTKCAPGEGLAVGIDVRRFLQGRGVEVTGEQRTKTRTALTFFSQALQGAGDAPADVAVSAS